MAPELVAEFVRAFNEEINRGRAERERLRRALEREQQDIAKRLDTLLDAFASGALRGGSVQAKLGALEARQAEIATELAASDREPVWLHPNLAAVYQQQISSLHELLKDEATRVEAVEIIRSLIEQVTFRPSSTGGVEIELVGDIARMVRFAHQPSEKDPVSGAVHDKFASSVKVVAGARSHLYRTAKALRKGPKAKEFES